jgi:hypothetical protein
MAQTTVATTAEIPAAIQPYYTGVGIPGQPEGPTLGGLLPAAQTFYAKSYQDVFGTPLAQAGLAGAGRIANLSPFQQQVGTELASMGTPEQFTAAQGYGTDAGTAFQNLTGAQAGQVGIGSITNQGVLGQYMSPYMNAVVEQQKQSALRDAQRSNLAQNLGSARQGTYGGARQLLGTLERERGLSSQLGNIQAQGLQTAYQQALAQFNAENQLGLTAQQANQQAGLQAQQQRLGAATGLSGLANTMGQLGVQQQGTDIERLRTVGAFGDLQRAVEQQRRDTQYQDLMTELGYDRTKLGEFSNLLRGVPLNDLTQTTTTPPPSFASQLAGLGVGASGILGLFNQPARS